MDISLIPELFDVELNYDGDIVSLDYYGQDISDEAQDEVEALINHWINKDLIELSEKTLCTVSKQDNKFYIKGKVCFEFGDVEEEDLWDEFELEIPF